jgi:hypothetical protein
MNTSSGTSFPVTNNDLAALSTIVRMQGDVGASSPTAVLTSSPSYPMVDPYNPATPFPERKTDTLSALNTAWATLSQPARS